MAYKDLAKELLGSIFFKGKHLLALEAILEYQEGGHPKDVVFLEIREDMRPGEDAVMRMMLNNTDLYHLANAIEEILELNQKILLTHFQKKQTKEIKMLGEYKKFTKSEAFTTKIFLGVKKTLAEKGALEDIFTTRFYLNIQRGKKTVVLGLSRIEIISLQERLRHFAKHIDTLLWKAQSKAKTNKKRNDNDI